MANTKQNPKDGLALVIGGLFILALVFATYNYFNKGKDVNKLEDETKQGVIFQKESEKGSLNGEGITETRQGQALGTGGPVQSSQTQTWVATDYKEGDIKGSTYTVKYGDTLWEISEAVYGNGSQWTKILNANKSLIGFLPNGSQALIFPGQVLTLP
ncbi:LysM peptidoglycan-binding domain-containing protein [candidate division WWE3 bacterium]|uniref:LysM peptidoglycan-binding domain-containing protein n=1 Tax=candidate division WWE3 bacterium TaxID=2053526 RepID=A0A7X9HSM9_UNCKA|nr:LysM peptidoglycan-binding domain-containing protein [candidate division WWE3 bacterium]